MYVVKNTGTMVIGFPECLKKGDDRKSLDSLSEKGSDDDEDVKEKAHKFQIVSSDTTVF